MVRPRDLLARLWVLMAGLVGVWPATAVAQAPAQIATPPLASGRSLAKPSEITTGDAMARAVLLRENLDLIRRFMGRAPAPTPLIRADGASIGEVYFIGLSVGVRSGQLAFEVLRVDRPFERPRLPTRAVTPADVFDVLDKSLSVVLRVKRGMGISTEPPERRQPDATDPTELFNLLLQTAGDVDHLLDEGVRGANAYVVTTVLVHQAMVFHLHDTGRTMMPDEPPFVPNKTPEDVFVELMASFELISKIAATIEMSVVTIQRVDTVQRRVHPNDLVDLAVLMISELDRMIRKLKLERDYLPEMAPRRKYPSHVLPRAKLLRAILTQVLAARTTGTQP